MEKLLYKLENLKKSLDQEESIKKIRILNKIIKEDQELIKKINEYKLCPTKKLKDDIYMNKNYKNYKETETDINILIFEINQKLKEINDGKNCV